MKRSIILMMALVAAGCADPTSVPPESRLLTGAPVQMTRLEEYFPMYFSGMGEQARLVVDNQAEWQRVWARVWAGHSPVPPVPVLDFEREVLLVAAMGSRPSSGYHVEVQAAAAQEDRVAVRVLETSPGSGCITLAAFTHPVDIVRLPRTPLPVRFHTVKTVHECG